MDRLLLSILLTSTLLATSLAGCAGTPDRALPTLEPDSARLLPAGRVVGFTSDAGAHTWRGIPFAQPPVGELRWRAPRALPPWPGTLEAHTPGPECVQFPMSFMSDDDPNTPVGSEDCLTLSVFAPPTSAHAVPTGDQRRPVMVWIHGGANMVGENASYDWSRFAVEHDTVVVGLNYRLGLFGWFRHEALWNEADHAFDRSGNFGTLDLIRGLEWVRDNASAFGGDPGNVTIFGESAGGNNVIALLLSPPARGLFHRAISQSGGTWSASVAEAENWEDDADPGRAYSAPEVLGQLLIEAGHAADRQGAIAVSKTMPREEIERFLRERTPDQLMSVLDKRGVANMESLPLTIREGQVVREGRMIDSFASGHYTRVPTMLGTNRDESKLFMMSDPEHVWKLFGLLPRIRDLERYERDAEYGSDAWKAGGVDELAIAMRRVQGPSVFAYRFDWDEAPTLWGTDLATLVGAAHGVEIPFVMGIPNLGAMDTFLVSDENTPGRNWLSERVRSYWTQFARTGDPGRGTGGDLPAWTAWDDSRQDSARLMLLDTEQDGGTRMSAESVTAEQLAVRVLADKRFTPEERCDRLATLAESFPRYAAASPATCGASRHAGRPSATAAGAGAAE